MSGSLRFEQKDSEQTEVAPCYWIMLTSFCAVVCTTLTIFMCVLLWNISGLLGTLNGINLPKSCVPNIDDPVAKEIYKHTKKKVTTNSGSNSDDGTIMNNLLKVYDYEWVGPFCMYQNWEKHGPSSANNYGPNDLIAETTYDLWCLGRPENDCDDMHESYGVVRHLVHHTTNTVISATEVKQALEASTDFQSDVAMVATTAALATEILQPNDDLMSDLFKMSFTTTPAQLTALPSAYTSHHPVNITTQPCVWRRRSRSWWVNVMFNS